MKKLLIFVLGAISSLVFQAGAGTLTINTDTATDTDIQAWCQSYAGLASAPSAAQVKTSCVIPLITSAVRAFKLTQSMNSIAPYTPSQMN